MPNATAFPPFGEGFSVVSIDSDADTLRIEWEPDPWHLPPEQLPTTLFVSPRVLDAANPRFADAGGLALLHVRLRRLSCSRCGQRVERISWLQRRARLTRRLADAVALWCARLPTRHVAEMFGLHWSSVRLFERRALEATLITLPAPQPKRLMMDEFALYKGHRYARVVLDAEA